jgi:ketosteroid isomerase-like protein
MKPRFAIAMLLVLALAIPATMLAQQSKAEKEVRAVIDELTQANLKGDAEAAAIFDKYLGDDFVRIPPSGAIYTKADMLDGWRTGKIKVDSLDLSDIKIHMYGNTAVATAISRAKSTVLGETMSGPTRYTRVFVKRGGIWQCVLYQNTIIAPPKTEDSATQTTNQLAGTYRLISVKTTIVATGEITEPLGKAPQGYIMYGRDGRMMILMVAEKRTKPSDLATMTNQERTDLFNTMLAYSGTYEFDGRTVTHHVDVSWNQFMTGTHQKRNVTLDGRKLVLAYTAPDPRTGVVSIGEITWEKVD